MLSVSPSLSHVACRLRRRGLTLVELIVVLMVLAAVAGILVPLFGSNIARKGSASSSLTNVAEIEKLMAMFANRHPLGHYPDHYDALRNSAGNVYTGLPGGGTGLAMHSLTNAEANALLVAGITTVRQMATLPTQPTFEPYDVANFGTPLSIETEDLAVVSLTPATTQALGLAAGGTYVVFGLGSACTLFSNHLGAEGMGPPVRFTGEASMNPAEVYQRFGVIFQISDAAGPLARARFVRGIGFGISGPVGLDQLVREWYDQ